MEHPSKPPRRRPSDPGLQRPEELTVAACLELLGGTDVGRLAVQLDDGGVDIFPVNFTIEGDSVLLRTAAGTKLTSLTNHPTVAFEADHFDWYERTAWSVVVKGDASVITDHDPSLGSLTFDLDSWQSDRKPFFVRISPSMTTGRRFAVRRRVVP